MRHLAADEVDHARMEKRKESRLGLEHAMTRNRLLGASLVSAVAGDATPQHGR